jgi:hypothetical protein
MGVTALANSVSTSKKETAQSQAANAAAIEHANYLHVYTFLANLSSDKYVTDLYYGSDGKGNPFIRSTDSRLEGDDNMYFLYIIDKPKHFIFDNLVTWPGLTYTLFSNSDINSTALKIVMPSPLTIDANVNGEALSDSLSPNAGGLFSAITTESSNKYNMFFQPPYNNSNVNVYKLFNLLINVVDNFSYYQIYLDSDMISVYNPANIFMSNSPRITKESTQIIYGGD